MLQAAINLTPEEMGALGDAELQSSLDRVLPRIPDGLPSHVVHALVRRAAHSSIKAKRPSQVVDIVWSSGGARESGFNANAPRLHDVTGTSGRGVAFSHAAPSAAESFWRVEEEVWIIEYLAELMSAKEGRSGEIIALAQAIGRAPPPLAEASGATKYQEIVNTSLVVAAVVQSTACTTQQIKALLWVYEELERSAKDGKSSSFSLSAFFEDPWWASKMRGIWLLVADEGVAVPQMEQIVAALAAESSTVAQVDAAWSLAMRRMTVWKETLHEGLDEAVLRALAKDCGKQVTRLTRAAHGLPADLWMEAGQQLRSRCQWLHAFVNCSVLLAKLDPALNSMTASAEFASGMQQVKEYASLKMEEHDTALAEIQQAFADHSGRITSMEDIKSVESLLEKLADVNQISPVAAGAGFVLVSALPAAKEGAPAWRLPCSWRATMRAVDFIKHHKKIIELTGSAGDDGDIVFGQCLVSLRLWKQELGCTISSITAGPGSSLQGVLGKDTEHLSKSVELVKKWVMQRVQRQTASKRDTLIRAIERLEDIAGGRTGGSSWKEKLGAESCWSDVQHEADNHFVHQVGTTTTTLHEVMDEISLEINAARRDLENMYQDIYTRGLSEAQLPVGLDRRIKVAQKNAVITHAESWFYQTLTSHAAGRVFLIQKQMESMRQRAIESDSLQPAIWRKAQLLARKAQLLGRRDSQPVNML